MESFSTRETFHENRVEREQVPTQIDTLPIHEEIDYGQLKDQDITDLKMAWRNRTTSFQQGGREAFKKILADIHGGIVPMKGVYRYQYYIAPSEGLEGTFSKESGIARYYSGHNERSGWFPMERTQVCIGDAWLDVDAFQSAFNWVNTVEREQAEIRALWIPLKARFDALFNKTSSEAQAKEYEQFSFLRGECHLIPDVIWQRISPVEVFLKAHPFDFGYDANPLRKGAQYSGTTDRTFTNWADYVPAKILREHLPWMETEVALAEADSDAVLHYFGGHEYEPGQGRQGDYYVIKSDGTLREPDFESTSRKGTRISGVWRSINPDEVVLYTTGMRPTRSDLLASRELKVAYVPPSGETLEQMSKIGSSDIPGRY